MMDNYDGIMKMLQDEYLSIDVSNYFSDVDGMHLWHIDTKLVKEFNEIDENCEHECVAKLSQGLIIPSEMVFGNDSNYINYQSCLELCDSISADLLAVYEALFTDYTIDKSITKELGISEEDAFESEILYFEQVEYNQPDDLKKLINCLSVVKEGSAAHFCKIAVVILNYQKENSIVKIFLDCGWKFKSLDGQGVIVYTKI